MERCQYCFITILNVQSADAFFQAVKTKFRTKNVRGQRRDNAGKDKIIHLFLETRKSAIKCGVDAMT